jgi:hypothetical protein
MSEREIREATISPRQTRKKRDTNKFFQFACNASVC